MIACNEMNDLCNYASDATYCQCPTDEQVRQGVVPLDSLPAAWWNWMWGQTNGAVNISKMTLTSIICEINNVLCYAGYTPREACTDQLYQSINKLRQTIGNTTTAGAVKSSTTCGKVSIDPDGIMTANGLGNVTSLSTKAKNNVVDAVNELKNSYDFHFSTLDTCTETLGSNKAPNNHASSSTTYGVGNASSYGHLKISDTYSTSVGGVAEGVAASQKALYDAYRSLSTVGYATLGNTVSCDLGNVATVGIATTAARSDHVHRIPSCLAFYTPHTTEGCTDGISYLKFYLCTNNTSIPVGTDCLNFLFSFPLTCAEGCCTYQTVYMCPVCCMKVHCATNAFCSCHSCSLQHYCDMLCSGATGKSVPVYFTDNVACTGSWVSCPLILCCHSGSWDCCTEAYITPTSRVDCASCASRATLSCCAFRLCYGACGLCKVGAAPSCAIYWKNCSGCLALVLPYGTDNLSPVCAVPAGCCICIYYTCTPKLIRLY